MMKWKLDDLPIFVAVVERGSITAAANWLGKPKSTVSQSISRLEAALGIRLLERNSRAVRTTSDGQSFFRQCQLVMEQVKEAETLMSGLTALPSGKLTVATPPAFCQEILAPKLHSFIQMFPKINLELVVTSHNVNIIRDQIDIAIVVGALEDSDLISKRLLKGRLIWVASADYARQIEHKETLQDLLDHFWICETRYANQRLNIHVGKQRTELDLGKNMIQINDPISVRRAIMNGSGVTMLPERYCATQIGEGSLVELFEHITFDQTHSILSVVYPSRRLTSPRTRAFLEFLSQL